MIHVSDHALVKFLEKAAGLDVRALKEKIGHALERARIAADQLDAGEYKIKAEGVTFVIRDGPLITIITAAPAAGFES